MATQESSRTLISQAQLNRKGGRVVYWIILTGVVVSFSVIFLFPLYWMVTGGLKSGPEVAAVPPTLVPKHSEWQNYLDAWNQLSLGRLLWNTITYVFGALAFQLVFDTAAAYAFSKLRPVLGKALLGAMLATLMIPATVLIVPAYVTVLDLPIFHWDLVDKPWVIWLPTVTNAFNIFLLKRFFDSIPQDLMSAAAIDGAGPLRTLWSIILPMSRPILGVVSIFAVTNVWKDFLWPLLVTTSTQTRTVNVGIVAFSKGLPQNTVIAAAVIAAVPTIVFFLILQKNIIAGLTAGSLKG
jgi:multiple sugar transport system permease protein